MKILNFLFIIYLGTISLSCKKEPNANFKTSSTNIELGEIITFTDLSENATEWYWDFGDGNSSREQNPLHKYTTHGRFTVILEIENDYGESRLEKRNYISVNIAKFEEIQRGELVDERDGKSYITLKIGSQWWMAENLKYDGGSFFYDKDDTRGFKKFGYLYQAAKFSEICPEGWHVPSRQEWEVLFQTLIYNGYDYEGNPNGRKIAKAIASKEYWAEIDTINLNPGSIGYLPQENNSTGFNILPAGYLSGSYFMGQGYSSWYWTSDWEITERDFNFIDYYYLNLRINRSSYTLVQHTIPQIYMCIRCIRD